MADVASRQQSYANQRLKEIRDSYKDYKKTPRQHREETARSREEMLAHVIRNRCPPEIIAMWKEKVESCSKETDDMYDEYAKVPIVSWTYSDPTNRQVTITSEGSRHWRAATPDDVGTIVFLSMENEFGELDDTVEEEDDNFSDVVNTGAVIYTQSGKQERPRVDCSNTFEFVQVVPQEVLDGVRNEAPPGKFFSGRTTVGNNATWSPAPPGQVWFQHPYLKNPHGSYYSDHDYHHLEFLIRIGQLSNDPQKGWELRGSKAYWCPVLKRFLSEGGRLRQEHWFHNGDGSAQQRYFYSQFEMLDRHGGLASVPQHLNEDADVAVMEVLSPQDVVNLKFQIAEKQGKIINLE